MSCSVSNNCLNNQNCFNCCWDDDKYSPYGQNLYNPIDRKIKQPIQQAQKQERKDAKAEKRKSENAAKKQSKDKGRQELLKKAAKAEATVLKTLNSGRIGLDGDMKTSDITIDVKLKSTSKDWNITHDEFNKVQSDAARGNREFGVIAATNKLGQTVYVLPEELFRRFINELETSTS